jgi:hypothetical protein
MTGRSESREEKAHFRPNRVPARRVLDRHDLLSVQSFIPVLASVSVTLLVILEWGVRSNLLSQRPRLALFGWRVRDVLF